MRSQILSATANLKLLFRECAIQANSLIILIATLSILIIDLQLPLGVAAGVPAVERVRHLDLDRVVPHHVKFERCHLVSSSTEHRFDQNPCGNVLYTTSMGTASPEKEDP